MLISSYDYENNIDPNHFQKNLLNTKMCMNIKIKSLKLSHKISIWGSNLFKFPEDDLIRNILLLVIRDLNRKSWNFWDNQYQITTITYLISC